VARKSQKLKRTLNDIDRFFIAHNKDMTEAELSKKLTVSVKPIREYREQLELESDAHITKAREDENDRFLKKRGAVVMTEAQSEISDSVSRRPSYMDNCVAKIKED
jgi:hypothetical protein